MVIVSCCRRRATERLCARIPIPVLAVGTFAVLAVASPEGHRWTAGGTGQPAEGRPAAGIARSYEAQAKRILDAALAGNDAYRKLEELCDDIGNRFSGSQNLDRAIVWAVETLRRDGHENVHSETVMVPKWVRGRESLELIEPQRQPVPMLGLGGSVGTPPEGITAPVVAVFDEQELERLGKQVRGKIVLFDHPMSSENEQHGAGYGSAVRFRGAGARLAAKYGAVAALVRSVTTRSLQSPHTGGMGYGDAEAKIPAAAISTEFAAKITRLQKRGIPVTVTLKMEAKLHDEPVESANVIAELRGRERPEEVVVVGGHIDSWDVGQGAHDDGAGCVTAMEALKVLRKLDLRPRRTIRVVLWTNEENGLAGGRTYAKDHEDELPRHVAAIEADSGGFRPLGFGITLADETAQKIATEQLREILTLLEPIGATAVQVGHGGADIGPLRPAGVPCLGLSVDMTHYFDVHHTHADTLDKVDPQDLSKDVAAMAVVAYVLADMPGRLGQPVE